ncbi:MAG: DUF1573 domain-containing protein [Candidatus Omnitrophota bacterium]
MKKIAIIPFFILLLFSANAHSENTSLTILHTNSTNGYIEACPTCPNRLFGGLPRRATLVKEYRQKEKNVLLLDSGDFFPVLAEKERAFCVVEGMNLLKYDAVALGDQEFLYGQEFIREVIAKAKFPFLSATIVDEKTGNYFTRHYIIKEFSGIKVAIIGLTSPKAFFFFPREQIEGLKILDPVETVRRIIEKIKGRVDLIVVLSHLGYEEDERLAKEVAGIDVIVGGHDQTLLPEPVRIGQTIIVQAGKNSENLGELKLSLDENKRITSCEGKVIPLTLTISDDGEISLLIKNFKEELAKKEASTPKKKTDIWGPTLQVLRTEWDVGSIPEGKILTKEMTIKNIGSQTLVISKVRSSCDCLTAKLDKETLVPSETGNLSLRFTPENIPGKFSYTVFLQTNDPENQLAKIPVKGEVLRVPYPKAPSSVRIEVLFFFSPNCRTCRKVKEEIIPQIRLRYGSRISMKELDISKEENYARLVELEDKHNVKKTAPIEVFVGGSYLSGYREIKENLDRVIEKELVLLPEGVKPSTTPHSREKIIRRFRKFSVPAVMFAGFLDGINPCAFAAIVFLVSLLSLFKRKKKEILIAGLSFSLGVFFAYLFLGIGLFWGIRTVFQVKIVSEIIFYGIASFVFLLGIISLKDAYLFSRTGKTSSITLQLPKSIKYKMHRIMREKVGVKGLAGSIFLAGFIVSFLESICTGQVYLPTITFIISEPSLAKKAYLYLVLYNLLFILPLVLVFFLVYFGTGWERLSRFGEKRLVMVKVLTGLFFIGLAVLLFFMH